MEKRAHPVPGCLATCVHPAPARASCGGHPRRREEGGGAGPGYTPLRPLGPKMQDVGQDSVQHGAEGTLAIRTFSALLS